MPESSNYPKVVATKHDHYAKIIFSNPSRRNAMTMVMWKELYEHICKLEADPDIRVIALTGDGQKAFVSGADISEFKILRQDAKKSAAYNQIVAQAENKLSECSKPTVALIDGYCIGGGMGIAMSCDIRIATPVSKFGIPAAKLGLGYPLSNIQRLVALVGMAKASEILFTGRLFDHEAALQIGLINHVIVSEELMSFSNLIINDIAHNAPLTIKAAKTAIMSTLPTTSSEDLKQISNAINACFDSQDYAEGCLAFMEKRDPIFNGN
jgi:enoyl-CoA hydratase